MYFRSLKTNVMRYFIFTILLIVPLLLTAQSKKEQIATLNLRVDSIFEVLVNERINNEQTLSDKSEKIFQLSQEKEDLEMWGTSLSQRLTAMTDSIDQQNEAFSKLYIYTGEMENGQFNGQGTFTSTDGDVYSGEWKDDQPNGQGTITAADGSVTSGIWLDGKLVDPK